MEDSYYYDEEKQGGYYEEYYDPNQGGEYYYDDCSDYPYPVHECYTDETVESCGSMVEEPRPKWEELLDRCITELEENRKVTNQRLKNLERNTGALERSLSNLALQVGNLEYNMGILATALGSKHTPGQFPSLPEINPKGNCHAVQLRSGTGYEPLNPSDLGRARKEKAKEQLKPEQKESASSSQNRRSPLKITPATHWKCRCH